LCRTLSVSPSRKETTVVVRLAANSGARWSPSDRLY
jgi:hypothetical protein